jgi:Transcription elongation factor, GreA/GreB, C-term
MARTADPNATKPSTAASGQPRPARLRPPESEAAVVLTPDGRQWLLARAAWLATEPDQASWSDGGYGRGAAELARLNEVLALAITTEELPHERPGVVELGDEVTVEFAADETERFLLVDPAEAPLDDVRISVESPLAKAVLGRRVGEQVEVEAPAGRYRCRILATGRYRSGAASPADSSRAEHSKEG